MEERILCAAIWYNDGQNTYVHQPKNIISGFVVCGRRHHNIIATVAMLAGLETIPDKHPITQGFLTNTDRFVDRFEAMQIVIKSGQVLLQNVKSNKLYSEDLY